MTLLQWLILLFSAVNVGFAKTGLQGSTMPAVIFMALAFGGQASSSMMLVMLIIGDLFAVKKYGKQVSIKSILRLMPATFIGVILGAFVGNVINDQQFMTLIAIIVFFCLFLLIVQEINKRAVEFKDNPLISGIVGVVNGFASMVGNASGPIFNVYILAKNIKKEEMIASIAWFFICLNVIKLPFHIFLWYSFSRQTLILGLLTIPIIFIGTRLGIYLVNHIDDRTYRRLMIIVTGLAALQLLF